MEPIDPAAPRRPGNPNMRPGMPSVNPSGRPRGARGIAAYVAAQTDDGRELVDRLIAISRGDKSITREMREATMALIDRLAGKPMQPTEMLALQRIEHAPALPVGWESLSLEAKRKYLDELEVRRVHGGRALALLPSGDVDD